MAAAKTAITVAPAPAPPISRPAITTGSVEPAPASTEPAASTTTPATSTRSGLHRAINRPATGIASAEVSDHAARIQAVAPNGTASARPMAGSATAGAPSATYIGSTSIPSVSPSRRPSALAASAAGIL